MTKERKTHVLIVDDEDRFRTITAATLKRHGFQVSTASGGIEAIWEIENGDFDVIVLDIKMPGMDGHRALREIKRLRPEIMVIMLTGHGSMDSAMEGLRDNVFAYMAKPCDIDLLINRIREAAAIKTRPLVHSLEQSTQRDDQQDA